MPVINPPAVVAEISALHDAYERALAANDIAALNGFFWDSPHVVRFGVSEHLYGAAAIAAYRQTHTPVVSDRVLLRRTVVAFDTAVVSVNCEFSQKVSGQPRHSRQSQVWVLLPEVGWKIVSAHVSNALPAAPGASAWEAYADQAAKAIGLPLDPAHRAGVIQTLERSAAIAAPFLAFPLPPDTEMAPVFTS